MILDTPLMRELSVAEQRYQAVISDGLYNRLPAAADTQVNGGTRSRRGVDGHHAYAFICPRYDGGETAGSARGPAAEPSVAATWSNWATRQHLTGATAIPDYANPEQMNRYSGSVIGAFAGPELVGVAVAFLADPHEPHLHSHVVGVAPGLQRRSGAKAAPARPGVWSTAWIG
jgi:hypothetical protein